MCLLIEPLLQGGTAAMVRQQGRISDGRQVLHVQPFRYGRWSHVTAVSSGDWISAELEPLGSPPGGVALSGSLLGLHQTRNLDHQAQQPCAAPINERYTTVGRQTCAGTDV